MRKIVAPDVFEALRLIEKSGLKDSLIPVIEDVVNKEYTIERAGILGVLSIMEVFSSKNCENLIYEWLSGPCECKPEDIKKWDLDTLGKNLTDLAERNNLSNFFTVLSKLATKKH